MLEQTGCAGVSIGRGAFYDPWIFRHTRRYLATGELPPEPGFEERVKVMCRHLDLMVGVFGEEHGCRMFRKIGPWYARRFGPANEFNKRIVTLSNKARIPGNPGALPASGAGNSWTKTGGSNPTTARRRWWPPSCGKGPPPPGAGKSPCPKAPSKSGDRRSGGIIRIENRE